MFLLVFRFTLLSTNVDPAGGSLFKGNGLPAAVCQVMSGSMFDGRLRLGSFRQPIPRSLPRT